ncbi:hypothetical protein [Halalkalibacter oceani]|uniref:hypothetical protein n=1 Tax=Halalkalibacter oceani TaxID=1653776 RepID=UPI00339591A4
MGLDLSGVDNSPINNIAINAGIMIIVTIVVTGLVTMTLRAIKIPEVLVNKLIAFIAIIILVGTFYIMDLWGLFVGF